MGQECAGHPWQVQCCDLCRAPGPGASALVSGPVWDAFGFAASLEKARSPVDPGSSCQPGMNLLCTLGLPSCWRPQFRQLSPGLSQVQAQQRRKLL